MSCNTGCYNPCGPSSGVPSSCGTNLSGGLGSCYRPQVNCWGPAYNVKCTQTIFCGCGTSSGVNVNVTAPGTPGTVIAGASDGSCTGVWELSIQGSGLSIISVCNDGDSSLTNTAIAGLICSCPNNFTTTATLTTTLTTSLTTSIQRLNGCMSWCICGCNVCGSGTLSGNGDASKSISVQGCCYSNCGTRTICINSIHI